MFVREKEVFKSVVQLNHTCIVRSDRALEATEYRPLALVFECCEGGSLKDLLQRELLRLRGATEVVFQIAGASLDVAKLSVTVVIEVKKADFALNF